MTRSTIGMMITRPGPRTPMARPSRIWTRRRRGRPLHRPGGFHPEPEALDRHDLDAPSTGDGSVSRHRAPLLGPDADDADRIEVLDHHARGSQQALEPERRR